MLGGRARASRSRYVHGWGAAALGLWLAIAPAGAMAAVVRDDIGQSVRIAQPARRIVSLAPHATELLYAAGAGSYIVGTVQYSDYPAPARRLPRVGGADAINLERIVSLKPDLIVAWLTGNNRAQVERLASFGIPVFWSEPRHLDDIATNIERLGRLAGTTVQAQQAARAFRQRIAALRARYQDLAAVRVFYEIWNQPLMTVNGRHLISDVLRLCGAVNVFDDLPTLAGSVNMEAVLAANPQVIVVVAAPAQREAWLAAWRRWPQLAAVQARHVYAVDPDLLQRQGPRIAEGAAQLCRDIDATR